jgi:hypothetical protein
MYQTSCKQNHQRFERFEEISFVHKWEQKWRDPLWNVLVPKYNSLPCTIRILNGGIQDHTDFAKTTLNPKPKPVTK